MIDYSKPSTVTGIERAMHEIVCAASFARIVEAMQKHVVTVAVSRMVLEGAPFVEGETIQ